MYGIQVKRGNMWCWISGEYNAREEAEAVLTEWEGPVRYIDDSEAGPEYRICRLDDTYYMVR